MDRYDDVMLNLAGSYLCIYAFDRFAKLWHALRRDLWEVLLTRFDAELEHCVRSSVDSTPAARTASKMKMRRSLDELLFRRYEPPGEKVEAVRLDLNKGKAQSRLFIWQSRKSLKLNYSFFHSLCFHQLRRDC